jgi:hypothetical protein
MLAACECSGRVRDAFAARGWEAWSADVLPSETPVFDEMYGGPEFEKTPSPEDCTPGGRHYQGDVLDLLDPLHPVNLPHGVPRASPWDLVIAFPPCTHLSLAGAVWWKVKRLPRGYWDDASDKWIELPSVQDEAASFFMEMVNAPSSLVAVENPRGDMTRRYRPPDQYVQPYMFGDPLIKSTGLWLKGLPLLRAEAHTLKEEQELMRVATGGGSWRTDIKHGRGASNRHEDGEGRINRQRVRNRTPPGLARAMADQWGPFAEKYYGYLEEK